MTHFIAVGHINSITEEKELRNGVKAIFFEVNVEDHQGRVQTTPIAAFNKMVDSMNEAGLSEGDFLTCQGRISCQEKEMDNGKVFRNPKLVLGHFYMHYSAKDKRMKEERAQRDGTTDSEEEIDVENIPF